MTVMNLLAVVCTIWMVSVAGAIDFAPTNVVAPQFKTIPPSDDHGQQYVQVVYKETDHKTMIHTVEPLRPSYEVSYHPTSYTTINNQTISTSAVEFATVLNTTVLYYTELASNGTYDVAATHFQTIDFTSEKIRYTPIKGDTVSAVTITETNALPFV